MTRDSADLTKESLKSAAPEAEAPMQDAAE